MRSPLTTTQGITENRLLVLFAAVVGCVVAVYRQHPTSSLWLPAALAGIAVATWHGAYDAVLARGVLQPRFPHAWEIPFYAGYLALGAIVLVLWSFAPVVALMAFLFYSAFHFGTEAEHRHSPRYLVSATALGFFPIAATCHWHPFAVTQILSTMLRGRQAAAAQTAIVAGLSLVPVTALSLLGALPNWQHALRRGVLLTVQLVLFQQCPPLIAFAVFFCVWHTPEHLVETSRDAAGRFRSGIMWRNLRAGVLPWLLTLAAVASVAWVGRHALQAYVGLVFIALSALTVPHMALALLVSASRAEAAQQRFLRRESEAY